MPAEPLQEAPESRTNAPRRRRAKAPYDEEPRRRSRTSSFAKSARSLLGTGTSALESQVHPDSRPYLPSLSRIAEGRSQDSWDAGSNASADSWNSRSHGESRESRSSRRSSAAAAENQRRLQGQVRAALTSPSMHSVVSSMTSNSSSSGGSNSTVTPSSVGGRSRRSVYDRPRHERRRSREEHYSFEDDARSEKVDVFNYLAPDGSSVADQEGGWSSTPSSSEGEESEESEDEDEEEADDAQEAHQGQYTPASSVTHSSSDSPTLSLKPGRGRSWPTTDAPQTGSSRESSLASSDKDKQPSVEDADSDEDEDEHIVSVENVVPDTHEEDEGYEEGKHAAYDEHEEDEHHEDTHEEEDEHEHEDEGEERQRHVEFEQQPHPAAKPWSRSSSTTGSQHSEDRASRPPHPLDHRHQQQYMVPPTSMVPYAAPPPPPHPMQLATVSVPPPVPEPPPIVRRRRSSRKTGYDLLASQLSSRRGSLVEPGERAPLTPLYRRFEGLNHRVLLHMQDELAEMEEHLQELDDYIAHAMAAAGDPPASRRADARYGGEVQFQRTELLGRIFVKLTQYNDALAAYGRASRETGIPRPEDVQRYRALAARLQPVAAEEMRFLDAPGDLLRICAGPGAENEETASTHDNEAKRNVPDAKASSAAADERKKYLLIAAMPAGLILVGVLGLAMTSSLAVRLLLALVLSGSTFAATHHFNIGADILGYNERAGMVGAYAVGLLGIALMLP